MLPAIVFLFIPLSDINADTQNEIPHIYNRQSKHVRNWRKLQNRRRTIGTRELNQLRQNDNFHLRENPFVPGERRLRPQVATDDWTNVNRPTADQVSSQFGHSHPSDTGTLKQHLPALRKQYSKKMKHRQRFSNGRQNLKNKQLDKPTKTESMTNKSESDFISALIYLRNDFFQKKNWWN